MTSVSIYLSTNYVAGTGDRLAARCAAHYLSVQDRSAETVEVAHSANGRPYLVAGEGLLSISHTGSIWVCALSDKPLGIDVECHREKDYSAIVRRHFEPGDAARTNGADAEFYRLWTARESVIKYFAGSLEAIRGLCFLPQPSRAGEAVALALRWFASLPEHTMCLCTERAPEAVRLHRIEDI
ncbi:MAG: 4'-phosphopantetheinyl transferase superfamily protein [Clostridiales bacterium]|nr:4'-phosphopantetheinyl transferase superfamily protein [Clostridiales bacterium]